MKKGKQQKEKAVTEESKVADRWADEFLETCVSPMSPSTLAGSLSLDSRSTYVDGPKHEGESALKKCCCAVFRIPARMRRRRRRPMVKRSIQHAFRKPFEVIPSRSVPWRELFEILPLSDFRSAEYFRKTLPTTHKPKSVDQGGRTLLWHAVRIGDELAVEQLLACGHGDCVTRKDNVAKLDCCDLAALFEHNHIISMLDKALASPASKEQSRFCSPFKTCKTARHIARLDVDVQPIPEVFWFDLYEMMPLEDSPDASDEIDRFRELALLIADADSLGIRDQNGATVVWHAARLRDETALKILLQYDQIDDNLTAVDHQFGLDALTITIIAHNNKMYSALSTKTRDVLETARVAQLRKFRENSSRMIHQQALY